MTQPNPNYSWPAPSLHLLLCVVAIILAVLVYANVLHVDTFDHAVGVVVGVVAILSAF